MEMQVTYVATSCAVLAGAENGADTGIPEKMKPQNTRRFQSSHSVMTTRITDVGDPIVASCIAHEMKRTMPG